MRWVVLSQAWPEWGDSSRWVCMLSTKQDDTVLEVKWHYICHVCTRVRRLTSKPPKELCLWIVAGWCTHILYGVSGTEVLVILPLLVHHSIAGSNLDWQWRHAVLVHCIVGWCLCLLVRCSGWPTIRFPQQWLSQALNSVWYLEVLVAFIWILVSIDLMYESELWPCKTPELVLIPQECSS
jgi:hypothetical protein